MNDKGYPEFDKGYPKFSKGYPEFDKAYPVFYMGYPYPEINIRGGKLFDERGLHPYGGS